ncbi:MAG: hypothetical protein WB797_17875 [Nocardioides sp.]
MSAHIGLPLAAASFDSRDPIENMAEPAGWGSFIIELPARAAVAQH